MRRTMRHAALAAALALGVTSIANAVPIKIEFTGTVVAAGRTDATLTTVAEPAYLGQSVVGWFLIETEGLQESLTVGGPFSGLAFNDAAGAPELVTSSLTIGGNAIDVALYDLNTGGIRYQDSAGPVSCGAGCTTTPPDRFFLNDFSSQVMLAPFVLPAPFDLPPPGTYFGRNLQLFSAARSDPANPDALTSYFDLSEDLDALSAVSLPMDPSTQTVRGSFSELTTICEQLGCRTFSSLGLGFDVTSISRRIEVPEPGTLSLTALAMLALGATRRRRR